MADDAVGERVVAEILVGLVRVAVLHLGREEQREADGIVVGLVPPILAVVEYGHAVLAGGIGKVGPLMRIDLIGLGSVVATLHAAKPNVVGSLRVAHRQREVGLEHRVRLLPVHVAAYVDTRCLRALVKTNVLGDGRLPECPVNAQGPAEGTVFHKSHADLSLYGLRLLVKRLLQDFPSRPGI